MPPTEKLQANWLSKNAANTLKAQIREYWESRGYEVRVWAEEVPGSARNWQVRSNLIGGLPS